MTARTHDAFAFASLLTIATLLPPDNLNISTLGICIVANIVGSLLPDIDQAGNRLWDLVPGGNHIAKVGRRLFMGHRTITHSLLGAYLVYVGSQILFKNIFNPNVVNIQHVWASFMIGYLSHLLLDATTKDGIPLLFPSRLKFGFPPIRFLRVTTGSWVENLLVLPGISIYILVFVQKNQNSLLSIAKLLQ